MTSGRHTLPIGVEWPGFAANTTFYAVAWWILLLAPRQARRALRRRRGACVKCGYDLAGLGTGAVCPECGGAGQARVGLTS